MPVSTNSLMYRLQPLQCACGWRGNGSEAEFGETISRLCFELVCPLCQAELAVGENLTQEQFVRMGQEHWERLGQEERAEVQSLMERIAYCELHMLATASQLPEIDEETFTLDWDQVGSETLLSLANLIIWREPVVYEGWGRFTEVARLLSSHYGPRLLDLRPSENSWLYLLGDDFQAQAGIERCRLELFGSK